MTDIVERLRDHESEGITRLDLFHLRNDAADEIERLRVELATTADVLAESVLKETRLREKAEAERNALLSDAERYRWLRERLIAADFCWGEKGETVLIFSFPGDVGVGGNCDQNIDAALAAKDQK